MGEMAKGQGYKGERSGRRGEMKDKVGEKTALLFT